MTCDCCRRATQTQHVDQGPVELILCDRCAADPFFDDRGLLRTIDNLQALVQHNVNQPKHVTKDGWLNQESASIAAWRTVEHNYSRSALGIGSSRIAMAFGPRLVAKIEWHGGPKDNWHATSNLLQAAIWLDADHEQAHHLLPCHALSKGGVLWTVRADPIAPPYNPTKPPTPNVFGIDTHAVDTRGAFRKWRSRIDAARAVLGTDLHADRPNNWANIDDHLVLLDALKELPDKAARLRTERTLEEFAHRDTDISLTRQETRDLRLLPR